MARSSFQKLKLLHVMNYLLQNSDEEHPITVNQMIQYLESNGIAAERKSIYDDIEALRTFGMDIEECKRGRVFGYYVASRTFELPELKLRVVNVVDTTPPEITLLSDPGYTPSWLDGYVEEGYTAHDAHDGDLTGAVRHQIHQQITAVHFLQQISNRGV